MSRWDVKVVFTQEFTFAIEADTSQEARDEATQRLSDDPQNPENAEMTVTVTRGLT